MSETQILQPSKSFREEMPKGKRLMQTIVRSIFPVALALIVAALILLVMGKNPVTFYWAIVEYGILGRNWQNSLSLLAPLLLIAIGLIVVFRGKLWNLGADGIYLLGAVVVVGFAPVILSNLPLWLAFTILSVGAMLVGALWTLIPAWLKAYFGTNEIITTLVMSTIGVGIANILTKTVFQDPLTTVPQTSAIPVSFMLPDIPGTRIHMGLLIAIGVAILFQIILKHTAFGLKLDVYGSNPKAAKHIGIDSRWMVVVLFLISGGLIGLGASVDMLGNWGYLRANWNPGFGFAIMPFVFLARLSPLASIPFVGFYAVLVTGGNIAAQGNDISVDFLTVITGLILAFMAVTEYVGTKKDLGQSYLPDELKAVLMKWNRTQKSARLKKGVQL